MASTERLSRPGPPFSAKVERLGLLSLRRPLLVAMATLALMAFAAVGVARIRVDDSLSQLFRSDTPEFALYERVTKEFPSTEYDLLIVVEEKTLLSRDALEKLRDLVTDVQLMDGVRGLISIFSARQPPESGRLPAPLFPDALPQGRAFDALVQRVLHNELIRGKLLSDDGALTLVVVALEPSLVQSDHLRALVDELRASMRNDLEGTKLKARLAGVPAMQLEIRDAVERDRRVYNTIGFVAGCAIAALFFRSLRFMLVAAAPPLIAILLALGALGWLDFRLNMFLNVMTPLIMVISFSDSMQLTFATRDGLLAGRSKTDALRHALLVVGPACVLTHATAGVSFIALQISSSALIRSFGEAGVIATLIALVAVLLLTPALGVLALSDRPDFVDSLRQGDIGVTTLRRFCAYVAARMVSHAGLYSLIGLVVVACLGAGYASLTPRYRLADQVPDRREAASASERLDAKLAGANPIDVLIELPAGETLYSPQTLEVIAATHTILEKQAGVGNVWSLETLRRWLAEKAGRSDVDTLKKYVAILPEHLTRRFISADQKAVIVSGRVADIDSSEILPVVERLDAALGALRATHPGYTIAVTGLSAIAARNSAEMIRKLNRGLTLEFVFVAAFIGAAFCSVVVTLCAILPGIFPIVASGALLGALGQGLQFASVVALTVSFGLGLSATIHFLNRQRQEEGPTDDPAVAVEKATVLVGPALILTSVVLACGLAVMIFSDLPSLRLFGWLSSFAMLSALVADLLILRPTAVFLRQSAGALAAWRAQRKPAL